ncbi:MAG: S41 family peptidase, partial [Gemmatimonadaceae bacterium]
LQEIGRATVVGVTTAGAVLPSVVALLPTGGALQHAISEYRTPRGTRLEGRGVTPSVEAPRPTRATLLAGRDEALELAMREARR